MPKYVKLTLTDEAAAALEKYQQAHDLKSLTGAIYALLEKGLATEGQSTPPLAKQWGDQSQHIKWMQREIRNAMRNTGDWDELLALGAEWREAYRLMGSPSDTDPEILNPPD